MTVSVRTALQLMIDTFGAEPDSCLECDYGTNGPTGIIPAGDACELCGSMRQALATAESAMAVPDSQHELLDALRDLADVDQRGGIDHSRPMFLAALRKARDAIARAEGRS
jgi:hypothetical protein